MNNRTLPWRGDPAARLGRGLAAALLGGTLVACSAGKDRAADSRIAADTAAAPATAVTDSAAGAAAAGATTTGTAAPTTGTTTQSASGAVAGARTTTGTATGATTAARSDTSRTHATTSARTSRSATGTSATGTTRAPAQNKMPPASEQRARATTTPSGAAGNAPGAANAGNASANASTQAAAAGGRDSLLVTSAEYEGWKTFHVYCYRCHGVDAMGSDIAPNLRHSVGPQGSIDHAAFVTTVKNGRPEKGMPTWGPLLSDEKIEQLWAYIKARSEGRLAPGRPHKAPSGE
jgi:mono/diheme cytochrome c family protein